jgi:uncharacterized protein
MTRQFIGLQKVEFNMAGEKDLAILLKSIKPEYHPGAFVFCVVPDISNIRLGDIILFFKEDEGYTIIVEKHVADRLHLAYTFIASWISLSVHSSLEAVGLTAAFSTALSGAGISCNVVAAYYHDHIFVNQVDTEKAMMVLNSLSAR